jgi:hypothetical protein
MAQTQHNAATERGDAPIAKADKVLLVVLLLGLAVFSGDYLFVYLREHGAPFQGAKDWLGGDFVVFWSTAKLVIDGHINALYDIAAFTAYQKNFIDLDPGALYLWPYPPHGLFLILPFGLLPYGAAYGLWVAVPFLFYVVAGTGGRTRWWHIIVLLVAPATLVNIVVGQNGFVTAGLLVGGMLLVDRRPILAGVLFGLLTFKPQMGVLIPVALAAAGLWRPCLSAAVTGLGLMAAASLIFGAGLWQDYLAFVPIFQETAVHATGAFTDLCPTAFMATRILGGGVALGYIVQAASASIAAVVVFLVFRRGRDRTLQTAVLAVGTLLVTPFAFNYDMTSSSLAVMLAAEHGLKTGFRTGERFVLVLAWILPISVMQLNSAGLPLAPLVLWVTLLYMTARALDWGVRRRPYLTGAHTPDNRTRASEGRLPVSV